MDKAGNYGITPLNTFREAECSVLCDLAQRSAAEQMAADERLALEGHSAIRLYCWRRPAVSLGWKQSPPAWLDSGRLEAERVELVERPSAGGIAFHGSDVSVAVVIPRARRSLHAVMQAACQSAASVCADAGAEADVLLEAPGGPRPVCCLTQRSPYGVYIKGQGEARDRKVAGFAVRRYPRSWLVQGSLLVQPLPRRLERLVPDALADQLREQAVPLSEAAGAAVGVAEVARHWAEWWSLWWDAVE